MTSILDDLILDKIIADAQARHDANAALLREALEALKLAVEWRDKLAASPSSQESWDALVEEDGCLDNEARIAITKLEERLK